MTPTDFLFQSRARRVHFGAGRIDRLEPEVAALPAARALVLTTPEQRALGEDAARRLGARCAGIHDRAAMHVPRAVVDAAVAEARRLGADALVAVGGGSTTGLAKAVALETGLPIVAVPTTFAGSEMTSVYGITDGGLKTTGRDDRVVPRTVLYDPELLRGLPPRIAATSGLNAIAHAAEGLYAHDGNPVVSLMAEEGIRALAEALPRLVAEGLSDAVAAGGLYGAWLCGMVLDGAAMGLHHKLCHALGGGFELPHAETHAVVLPHTLAYNAAHAPDAMRRLARALGGERSGPEGVHALLGGLGGLGVPQSLRELGMPASGLDTVAELAVRQPYPNPRPLERQALRDLLQRAWDGAPPAP